MTAVELLTELRRNGVEVAVFDDKLAVRDARGFLTAKHRMDLRRHREALVDLLTTDSVMRASHEPRAVSSCSSSPYASAAGGRERPPMRDRDPILQLDPAVLDQLIESWPKWGRPFSRHLHFEIMNAVHRGYRPDDPLPLKPGAPVPGCDCELCTGLPSNHPARQVAGIRRRGATKQPRKHLDVDAARCVPILDVVRQLDLGEPLRVGSEYRVRCPFHDDRRPSLRICPMKNVWYCDPCGCGGDTIELVMRVTGAGFRQAVLHLAGKRAGESTHSSTTTP